MWHPRIGALLPYTGSQSLPFDREGGASLWQAPLWRDDAPHVAGGGGGMPAAVPVRRRDSSCGRARPGAVTAGGAGLAGGFLPRLPLSMDAASSVVP